jgi:hypothetical protein
MGTQLQFHPAHGPHEPTDGTPRRRPGSVRRTSTVDSRRTGELERRVTLVGRARDLVTELDGTARTAGTVDLTVEIAYTNGPIVESIRVSPAVPEVDALVGRLASAGFRAAIDKTTGAQHGELAYLLLDDVPVATLVSGYAVGHAVKRGDLEKTSLMLLKVPGPPPHGADMCAGFQRGGTIMNEQALGGHAVVTGPLATQVVDPDDELGWHEFPIELRPDCMRRWRRLDLWRADDGTFQFETLFRDSHTATDGTETIIHEYSVVGRIDSETMTFLECESIPRVLPWKECPQAAGSGSRLVGQPVAGLRALARSQLTGITACTHLTDQLRELEDVATLVDLLPR